MNETEIQRSTNEIKHKSQSQSKITKFVFVQFRVSIKEKQPKRMKWKEIYRSKTKV